jgi:hypothetical protein
MNKKRIMKSVAKKNKKAAYKAELKKLRRELFTTDSVNAAMMIIYRAEKDKLRKKYGYHVGEGRAK